MKKLLLNLFFLCFIGGVYAQQIPLDLSGSDSSAIQDQPIQSADTDSKKSNPMLFSTNDALTPPSLGEIISLPKIFWSMVFLLAGYFLIKIISRILEVFAERSTKYRITIKSFIPVVKIMGWIGLIFIVVAGIFQPPAATLLAFSASIGVAVGFASQDILKNIFGGVMILFDRPFKSGDKIAAYGVGALVAGSLGIKGLAKTGALAAVLAFAKKAWFIVLFPFIFLFRKLSPKREK